jgi:hypothetical protein
LNNPGKGIPRPRRPADLFKKEAMEPLIKARDFCEEAMTDHRPEFIMQRAKFERDKAILLTLLDSGLGAGALEQRLAKFVMQV